MLYLSTPIAINSFVYRYTKKDPYFREKIMLNIVKPKSTKKSAVKKPKILTLVEVRAACKKKNAIILWPYRGHVESGNVIGLFCAGKASIIWLEGHHSRNEDIPFNDILAVHVKSGPEMTLGGYSGKGYVTRAGMRWLKASQKNTN